MGFPFPCTPLVPTPRPRTKLKANRNHRKSLQAYITILHVIYDIIMLQLLLKQL